MSPVTPSSAAGAPAAGLPGGLHFHPLRVAAVQADAGDAVIVTFEVPAPLREAFRFTQGQYLTLRRTLGGEEVRRSYSICAGLDDGALRVGIRRVPGGRFSHWAATALAPGEVIEAIPPQGHFHAPLEPGRARHHLGIAAGSGITPVLSILRTVLAREPLSRFTLVYGNRTQASTMFKEELEDLKNRHLARLAMFPLFSREQVDAPLSAGRITETKLSEFLGPLVDPAGIDEAYVCGPHGMIEAAESALHRAGVAPQRVHVERFGVPAGDPARTHEPQPGDRAEARITVIRDGVQREVDYHAGDGSLLEALGRSGLDIPYSCKSGVCATCRARLVAGEVRMDRSFALEPADREAGFVLTCQSHPLTPAVTVSFDAR
jgi:ring-1,2-phenylacetyl-CoA epoxidase subunit PaaE